jgi:hypothetical protein
MTSRIDSVAGAEDCILKRVPVAMDMQRTAFEAITPAKDRRRHHALPLEDH